MPYFGLYPAFAVLAAPIIPIPDTNEASTTNLQNIPLLEAPSNPDLATLFNDPHTSDMLSVASNSDSNSDSDSKSNTIFTYVVQSGDTVSGIAEKFDISANTIIWTNNLARKDSLSIGQKLVILPISGVQYTVKKGDNVGSIASKYNSSMSEIISFNGLDTNATLKVGDTIVIPDGELPSISSQSVTLAKTKSQSSSVVSKVASVALGIDIAKAAVSNSQVSNSTSYYIRPIVGGEKTQGIHGHNAVDLAEACGTPIHASAAGTVTIALQNGAWNGGYGNYVVINHNNGSQTLYAHMRTVIVSDGQTVSQNQQIGTIGNTGNVQGPTGCHVHFEIRNGIANPF